MADDLDLSRETEQERRTERRMLDAGRPLLEALARIGALSDEAIEACQERRGQAGARLLELPR